MTVRKKTLEENSKQTVLMNGSQTLIEAIQILQDKKLQENDTYLVVTLSDEVYRVILFSKLKEILMKLGVEYLTQSLSILPLPLASRIIPTNTEESGGDILDWLSTHPQSSVVITDAGKFTGLFINPNRAGDSGLADSISLQEIHGEFVRLSQDPRADFVRKVQPPICPHCHQTNFYRVNAAMQVFCPNCKGTIVMEV